MLKKINPLELVDRLRSLNSFKQSLLRHLKQGSIPIIVLGGLYFITPPLWKAINPQAQVEPLKQRIDDLDKQIKATKSPSITDLKEIATLEKGRIDSENTIRTGLFQAVGGLLVFVTLYISWRTLQANEAKQVAERFSKAVEQLGSENIHVRLGGIYALEQIAKDAEEKYYWQVMETLTSYVRVRSPWPPKAAKSHSSFVQALLEQTQTSATQSNETIPSLPTDIQAVMTVLARRKHSYGHPLERHPLDLHGADLRFLRLPPRTQLSYANLAKTNLQEAILKEVNLKEAYAEGANLQDTRLQGANLQEVKLGKAKLQGAYIEEANLKRAFLWKANLQKVFLWKSNLKGAILEEANLQGALLWKVNLQDADLARADLQRADLGGANLKGMFVGEASLQETKFKSYFPFQNAQVELHEAIGLTWGQLEMATSYEGAILPDYLPPRSQQFQAEEARSTKQATELLQSKDVLPAALNAIRILAASYKSE